MALILGTNASEILTGFDTHDNIYGEGGNDTLDGGAGDDTLEGGLGNDRVTGGEGNDVFGGQFSHGHDVYFGGGGNDSFFDIVGQDTLNGGTGADYFLINQIVLAGTNDPIGAEATATGGAGMDTYEFGAAAVGGPYRDLAYTITDFAVGAGGDVIDVDAMLLDSAGQVFADPYTGGNPFDPALGFLELVQSGADTLLRYDGDGVGNAFTAHTVLTLRNVTASDLTAANFAGGIAPDGSPVDGVNLVGTAGGESLSGGFFDDTIAGLDSNDTLNGGGGNDSILGGLGNDVIGGGWGNDTLRGGDGDDRFIVAYRGTASVATGGAGQDTYQVEAAYANRGYVVTDFTTGPGGDDIDVFLLLQESARFEMFGGEAYNGGNPFDPALGFLDLVQSAGNVVLKWDFDGAAGDVHAWKNVLTLKNVPLASLTADNFAGGIPPDGSLDDGQTLAGTGADDSIRGGIFDDSISDDAGNDVLLGNAGNDTLDAGSGNDSLGGGIGNDLVYGGSGNDQMGYAFNSYPGGDGVETKGNDTLYGGDGSDFFNDFAGNNRLDGGADDDTFHVFSRDGGISTLTGGAGRDTFTLFGVTTPIHHVIADFVAGPGGDLIDVHQVLGASESLGGYAGGNPFDLGYLALVQYGSNTLLKWDRDGAAGADYGLVKQVTLKNVLASSITSDNFVGQLVVGTSSNDDLVGGIGNDTVQGLAGDDTLDGSLGKDILQGGSGSDLYIVDNVDDAVVELNNDAPGALLLPGVGAVGPFGPGLLDVSGITDTVIAAVNYSLASLQYVENLTLTGAAAQATGNALANVLKGNALANTLTGGGGNDTLDGGGGNDLLAGGTGNDKLTGGTGNDALVWDVFDGKVQGGLGTDTLRVDGAGVTLDLVAIANTRITDVEVIRLTGSGNNTLKVALQDVLDLSSSTNELRVDGNAGDVVQRGAGWATGADEVIGANLYHTYTQSGATLKVDADITSLIL